MLEIEADTILDGAVLNLENRLLGSLRPSMQEVVDALAANIRSKFADQQLAETVKGEVAGRDTTERDEYEIVGTVFSTWPAMIWYERGRRPGGKMPPSAPLIEWAQRKGITPDPARTALAFAFAINASRAKKDRHWIPIAVLVEWQQSAGVTPTEEFAFNSLAYAIGKKIQRDGLPGHHYFEQGLQETRPFIAQTLERAVVATQGF